MPRGVYERKHIPKKKRRRPARKSIDFETGTDVKFRFTSVPALAYLAAAARVATSTFVKGTSKSILDGQSAILPDVCFVLNGMLLKY